VRRRSSRKYANPQPVSLWTWRPDQRRRTAVSRSPARPRGQPLEAAVLGRFCPRLSPSPIPRKSSDRQPRQGCSRRGRTAACLTRPVSRAAVVRIPDARRSRRRRFSGMRGHGTRERRGHRPMVRASRFPCRLPPPAYPATRSRIPSWFETFPARLLITTTAEDRRLQPRWVRELDPRQASPATQWRMPKHPSTKEVRMPKSEPRCWRGRQFRRSQIRWDVFWPPVSARTTGQVWPASLGLFSNSVILEKAVEAKANCGAMPVSAMRNGSAVAPGPIHPGVRSRQLLRISGFSL